MDTRKLRPDFRPQVVEDEINRAEAVQHELLHLPPFSEASEVWLEIPEADVSWFELMLYWLSELSWWRAYWNRTRN